MHMVLEVIWTLLVVTYYWMEAIVVFFIPKSWRRKDVTGEKVLITGAGGGLGRGMSMKFAALDCHLILWDINPAANEQTAEMCRDLGAKVNVYTCDLSKREDIYSVSDRVKQEVGDIDILINNAGIVTGRKFLDCPDAMMEATMNINCNAHFWTLKAFLPSMLARNHGHVVTIASMAGIAGLSGLIDYCASKFAAVGLTESLASELDNLGKTGVHTTMVCPTYINTGMFDGAYVKWEWMAPILEQDYVVNSIMDAILTNQSELKLPFIGHMVAYLKTILPYKAGMYFMRSSGILDSMSNFRGHAKKQ